MIEPLHLIYIHGFNSSPQSAKARVLAQAVRDQPAMQLHVPALPYDPQRTASILQTTVEQLLPERIGLVGSSMGGFYGGYLAETYRLPLVLVNPAVRPYELLQDYLGVNENIYTGEKYTFTLGHLDILRALDIPDITHPGRYLLLTQEGDEVLDYRQAVEKYAASPQIVETGGSHGFDGFENHVPAILEFLQQQASQTY